VTCPIFFDWETLSDLDGLAGDVRVFMMIHDFGPIDDSQFSGHRIKA
jgi:hypothetical protein